MKKYITLLFVFLISVPGLTYDWSNAGYETISEKSNGNYELVLQINSIQVSITAAEKIDDATSQKITEIQSKFNSWEIIKISKINYSVKKDQIDITVVPSEFIHNEVDFTDYLPVGFSFFYTAGLEYNFRIDVKNMFLKISGPYTNENDFVAKIEDAILHPLEFVRKRDSEYFLIKIEAFEKEIAQIKAESIAKEEKRDAEQEVIKYNLLTLNNTGFFSGPTAVDKKVLSEVIRIKKEKPEIKITEVRDELKKLNMEAGKKEVSLIFIIYFNEVEK